MITLHLHDKKYIALASAYAYKDAIKALAPYPDVKWDNDGRRWLVRAELLDKLIAHLGEHITGSVDFWLGFPLPRRKAVKPVKRRMTRQQAMAQKAQDAPAIAAFGKMLNEYSRLTRETPND